MSTLVSGAPAATSTGRGQSDESRIIREEVGKVSDRAAATITFAAHVDATMVLFEACANATKENWNGPGTSPISLLGYRNAERFVKVLPPWAPVPEIAVYPDGQIEFEWYAGQGRVFAVTVGDSDILNYAGLYGARTVHGTHRFVEEFPAEIQTRLMQLGSGIA